MEFLFSDGSSRVLLQGEAALMEHHLSEEQLKVIKNNNIIILYVCSPGSRIGKFLFPETKTGYHANIVILDHTICKHCCFSVDEKVAVILHEIGHLLNIPPSEKKELSDFYADYYVKTVGFKASLANSLKKYISSDLPFISLEMKTEIDQRIEALLDPNQSPLKGNIGQ